MRARLGTVFCLFYAHVRGSPVEIFWLEGRYSVVHSDDGKAFIWKAPSSTWGEISDDELRAAPGTPILTEGEFKIKALTSGADPSTVPTNSMPLDRGSDR